jgi:hypothetical protein
MGLAVLALAATPARAVDHNNIDAGRPLSFDDANSLAFGERALEFGFGLNAPRRGSAGLASHLEFLQGFALNSHFSIGFEPSVGGHGGSGSRRFDPGNVSLGLFRSLNRETDRSPALAVRADVLLPTGRESRTTGVRLRGILSRHVAQHDRLHVNVDLNLRPGARGDEREVSPALVLGWSRPLGYPIRFDTTGLAEIAVRQSEEKSEGAVVSVGVGLRRQMTVRSVLDVGLQSDVAAARNTARDALRLIAGWSTSF